MDTKLVDNPAYSPNSIGAKWRADAAGSRPPESSSERDRQLLLAGVEAGLGGLALSCLERIDLSGLDLHDRVTFLRLVHDHAAWLEALHCEATMAIAGPLDGWASEEMEEILYEGVTTHPLPPRGSMQRQASADGLDHTPDSPTSPRSSGSPEITGSAGVPLTMTEGCGQTVSAETPLADPHAPASAAEVQEWVEAADSVRTPSPGHFALSEADAWDAREAAATAEIALATTVSRRTAGRRVETTRFAHDHVRVLELARAGLWSYAHIRVAESELISHDAALIDAVLADVTAEPRRESPAQLSKRIRKSLARLDHAAMTERFRANRDKVAADAWMLPDGQGRLMITADHTRITETLDALNDLADAQRAALRAAGEPIPQADSLRGELVLTAIQRCLDSGDFSTGVRIPTGRSASAEGAAPETITLPTTIAGFLRAGPDTIAAAAEAGAAPADGGPSTASTDREGTSATAEPRAPRNTRTEPGTPTETARQRRRRKQAAIIVDLPTALGMANEPGYLPGYGWVPADIAREILADTEEWSRWLIDDSSRSLLDINSEKYRPSAALRRFIEARAQECTMPVCTRPASDSQLDHADDFDGTNTTTANLHPACGPDHLIITAGYFIPTLDSDGRATWTSTTSGHSYTNPIHPLFEAAETPQPVDAPVSTIEAFTAGFLRDAA